MSRSCSSPTFDTNIVKWQMALEFMGAPSLECQGAHSISRYCVRCFNRKWFSKLLVFLESFNLVLQRRQTFQSPCLSLYSVSLPPHLLIQFLTGGLACMTSWTHASTPQFSSPPLPHWLLQMYTIAQDFVIVLAALIVHPFLTFHQTNSLQELFNTFTFRHIQPHFQCSTKSLGPLAYLIRKLERIMPCTNMRVYQIQIAFKLSGKPEGQSILH